MFNPGETVWLVEGDKRREVTISGILGTTLVLVGRRTFDRESGYEFTRKANAPWGRLVKIEETRR